MLFRSQGLGKPNLIYVKNFISAVDSQLLNCENHNSGTMETYFMFSFMSFSFDVEFHYQLKVEKEAYKAMQIL